MSATAERVLKCPGCDATYRLPPSFSAPKARCKKCGTMMNLEGGARRPSNGSSRRPSGGSSRRPGTRGRSRAGSGQAAQQAVRERGRRSTIAMGQRAKQPLSGLHVLAGVGTLGVLVAFLIFAL